MKKLKYAEGDRFLLYRFQVDDDDGVERRTEAGEVIEVTLVLPENGENCYYVGCPKTGGSWFFTEDDLDGCRRVTGCPEPSMN